MMLTDTGFPRADVENAFLRVRRRQTLAGLAHWLRREPGRTSLLLPLDEVVGPLGWRGEHYLGLRVIRLDTIVRDGHHRVSIAIATGQTTIDAYVTEVLTADQRRASR